jgi:DNA polymerase-3 subunit epsilon
VDFAGRIIWKPILDAKGQPTTDKDGNVMKQEVFNFGKYKGRAVIDVLNSDPGYYNWIMTSEFTGNTKQVLTRIRLKNYNH